MSRFQPMSPSCVKRVARWVGLTPLPLVVMLAVVPGLGAPMAAAEAAGLDLSWHETLAPGALPTGWTLATDDPSPDHHLQFTPGGCRFGVAANRYLLLSRNLDSSDGSDDLPLRISCCLATDQPGAPQPVCLALCWSGQSQIAVRIAGSRGAPAAQDWTSHVEVVTAPAAAAGSSPATGCELFLGASPSYVRMVVTSRLIGVDAGSDGWNWTRIASIPRVDAFAKPPEHLLLGRGCQGARDDLQNDAPLATTKNTVALLQYRFGVVEITRRGATIPSASNLDYARKDSRAETLDALEHQGLITSWQVAGPCRHEQDAIGGLLAAGASGPLPTNAALVWKTLTIGDSPSERMIVLNQVLPGAGEASYRYALATITATTDHRERFLFDGSRDLTLYLNGEQLAMCRHDAAEVQLDQLSAVGSLRQGENRLVIRLGSGAGGRAVFCLRHEPGDPYSNLALEQRLAADFPDQVDSVQSALDASHGWEDLGFDRAATRALDDAVHAADTSPEQLDQILIERARLDHALGDESRMQEDIDALSTRWAAGNDAVAVRMRIAGQWERLGDAAKAQAALAAAALDPQAGPARQLQICSDRARLATQAHDPDAVVAALAAACQAIPAGDPRNSLVMQQLALRGFRQGANELTVLAGASSHADREGLLRISALEQISGDAAGRRATLAAVAAAWPVNDPEALTVWPQLLLAEQLLADHDLAGGVQAYHQALLQDTGAMLPAVQTALASVPSAAAAPDALRTVALLVALGDTAAGRALIDPAGVQGVAGDSAASAYVQGLLHPIARTTQVKTLVALIQGLLRRGAASDAWALEQALLRTGSDQPQFQLQSALDYLAWARQNGHPREIIAMEGFLDACPLCYLPANDAALCLARWQLMDALIDLQRFSDAASLAQLVGVSAFDARSQAENLRRQGDLQARAGDIAGAFAAYSQALDASSADQRLSAQISKAQRLAAPDKLPAGSGDTTIEISTRLAAAQRASAAGDASTAVAAWQQLGEDFGNQLARGPDGVWRSVSVISDMAMRALGPEGVTAYHDRCDERAARALALARLAGNAQSCDAVRARYPLSSSAAAALESAAERFSATGCWALAGATRERAMQEHPTSPQGLVDAAAAAFDLAMAQDGRGFEHLRAQLLMRPAGTTVTVNGAVVPLPETLARDSRLVHAVAAVGVPAITGATVIARFAVPLPCEQDLQRIPWLGTGQGLSRPASRDGLLVVGTLGGVHLIDLATRQERWNDAPDALARRSLLPSAGFGGVPESESAIRGGLTINRVLRGSLGVLEARDLASGALRWSSEGLLPGVSITSSPVAGEERVLARALSDGHSLVVAMDLQDGHLLWSTTISQRRPVIAVSGGNDIALDGSLAAPTINGRDCLVASELGSVVCLDLVSGAVGWSSPYARARFDPNLGDHAAAILAMRSPARVVVANERYLVAPRDSLSLLAITDHGEPAWTRHLECARQLCGVSADGLTAILAWRSVSAIDTRSGDEVWRWTPAFSDGETCGVPLITDTEVILCTQGALIRLALADGHLVSRQPWSAWALAGAIPTALVSTPAGLYGVGNGTVVAFATAATVAPSTPASSSVHQAAGSVTSLTGSWDRVDLPTGTLCPMSVSWCLGGERVLGITVPDGTPPGCCYVHFAHSLALVDVAGRRTCWRRVLPAEVVHIRYTADLIIISQARCVSAIETTSGQERWLISTAASDLDALRADSRPAQCFVNATTLAVVGRQNPVSISVYALDHGTLLGRIPPGLRSVLAIHEEGGWLTIIGEAGRTLWADRHPLEHLATISQHRALDLPASNRDTVVGFEHGVVITDGTQARCLDDLSNTVTPLPWSSGAQFWAFPSMHLVHLRPSKLAASWSISSPQLHALLATLDDPSTEIRGSQQLLVEGAEFMHADRGPTQWVVTRTHIEQAAAPASTTWQCPLPDSQRLVVRGLGSLPGRLVAVSSFGDEALVAHVIDQDHGTLLACGPLPGMPVPGPGGLPIASVGDCLLLGTSQELLVLQLKPQPVVVTLARSVLPGAAIDAPPVVVSPARTPLVIDGHLTDWPANAALTMTVLPPLGAASAAAPPRCQLHCCWDQGHLFLAIEVRSPWHQDPPPGAVPDGGDTVSLAIDTVGHQRLQCSLSLCDGRSVLHLDTPLAAPGAEAATMRASPSLDGICYELALPWSALGLGAAVVTPGTMLRLAALVVQQDGHHQPWRAELGYGLSAMWDPSLWRSCVLGGPATPVRP